MPNELILNICTSFVILQLFLKLTMQLNILTPFKSLNKAYLKEKVSRNNVELFKHELLQLFSKSEATFSENTLKDFITEFLRNTWYNPNHARAEGS